MFVEISMCPITRSLCKVLSLCLKTIYVLYLGECSVLNISNKERHLNVLSKFYVSFIFSVGLFCQFQKEKC